MISLTEDLALLALDEARGRPYDRAMSALPHAMAATLVMDLRSAGCIELGAGDEVVAIGSVPDDELLAEAWTSIRDGKGLSLRMRIARSTLLVKHLPMSVYEHLTARGVLAHDGTTRIIRRDRYREIDERPGRDLVAGLEAVLDGERDPDADELLLLALVKVCRLSSAVFPHRDARATDKRIDAAVAHDPEAGDVATKVARAAAGAAVAAIAGAV